jgi:hypothetical protein
MKFANQKATPPELVNRPDHVVDHLAINHYDTELIIFRFYECLALIFDPIFDEFARPTKQ